MKSMIQEHKVIVIDVDGTLCPVKQAGQDYANLQPNQAIVEKLREYKAEGFYIVIHSSRNMRTYQGDLGKIQANTLPVLIEWLKRHDIPYDEIHLGKPWQGRGGFYVDDKTIRPSEFLSKSYAEIQEIIDREQR